MEEKKEEAKTFVTRVQSGYRVQIPEPLRAVMGISEGDVLEVTIRKLKEKVEEAHGTDRAA